MTTSLRLLTIVAEAVLEDQLVRAVHAAGATGHTVTTGHGAGSRGVRTGLAGDGNVRIEIVVTPDVAAAVFDLLAEKYFPHYAVIAWQTEVEVLRGDKFA